MKALSFKQPMAWALFHGKDVDNRFKYTSMRGMILIHTSKTFSMEYWQWICDNENRLGPGNLPWYGDFYSEKDRTPDMFMGGIIGKINIVDCTQNNSSRWYFGKPYYALIIEKPILFDKPIPCRGMPGFFEPDIKLPEVT